MKLTSIDRIGTVRRPRPFTLHSVCPCCQKQQPEIPMNFCCLGQLIRAQEVQAILSTLDTIMRACFPEGLPEEVRRYRAELQSDLAQHSKSLLAVLQGGNSEASAEVQP